MILVASVHFEANKSDKSSSDLSPKYLHSRTFSLLLVFLESSGSKISRENTVSERIRYIPILFYLPERLSSFRDLRPLPSTLLEKNQQNHASTAQIWIFLSG